MTKLLDYIMCLFASDIEGVGTLYDGVGYPASRDQFTIAGNSQGKTINKS